MKHITLASLALTFLLVACNEKTADKMKPVSGEKKDTTQMNYAYKAEYSSDVSFGKPEHTKLVLDLFKAWEENRMDDMKPMLSDSVWVDFSDGSKFRGRSDSLINFGKGFRANYTSVRSVVDVFMPVHLNDKNEDYVLVWGRDYTTDKAGNVDSLGGHSYWMIQNNKIAGWGEYTQKLMAPPPNTNNK